MRSAHLIDLVPPLGLALLLACTREAPSDDSRPSDAVGDDAGQAAPARAESGDENPPDSEALLEDIEVARSLMETGHPAQARRALREVLRVDPRNDEASLLDERVRGMLGERGNGIGPGVSQEGLSPEEIEAQRVDGLRRDAEKYHRLAQEARARGHLEEAIGHFERVEVYIRWNPNVGWGDLAEENRAALEAARRERH